MKHVLKISLFLLIASLMSFSATAQQNFYKYRVGASGGSMHYFGDLTTDLPRFRNYAELTYGIQVERSFWKFVSLRLSGAKGHISYNDRTLDFFGDFVEDNENFDRGLNFRTDIMDASAALVLYPEGWLLDDKAFIAPYISGGFGVTWFDPYGDLLDDSGKPYNLSEPDLEQDEDFETDLRERDIEGANYDRRVFHIPVGLGIKFRLSDRWNLDLAANGRYAFSDYLDDVSSERGKDDEWNDIYVGFTAGVNYNFGLKKKSFKAPVIIADQHSFLTRTDSATYSLGNLSPADIEVVPAATKKDKQKASKEAKKQQKQAEKDALKNCKEACKQLPTRKERKACKKNCKIDSSNLPVIIVEEEADPIEEIFGDETYQNQLDSLENVIGNEQEVRQEGGDVTKMETPTEETTTTSDQTTNEAAAPVQQQPTTVVVPTAPTDNGSSAKADMNTREIDDLQMEMEILRQQMSNGANNSSSNDASNKDVIIEMYRIETDRLRQESSDNKIMGKLGEIEKELEIMRSGQATPQRAATIEKEIIIREDEPQKVVREIEVTEGEELQEEVEKMKEELKEEEIEVIEEEQEEGKKKKKREKRREKKNKGE